MKRYLTIILLVISKLGYCQLDFNFFSISLDKGLSNPRVNCISQDKFGYMWFGTPNGLNRYDGYAIKNFYSTSKVHSLPSSNITSLYNSKAGALWVGSATGLVSYNLATETFHKPDTTSALGVMMGKQKVNDMIEDEDGNIYFACELGIVRYNPASGKWDNLKDRPGSGSLRKVRSLTFFSKHLLLASTYDNIPFFMCDISTGITDSISMPVKGSPLSPHMFKVIKLSDTEILAGLLSFGTVKVDIVKKTYDYLPGLLRKNKDILYNAVYDILRDSRGRIWLATNYFKIAEYMPETDTVRTLNSINAQNPFAFKGRTALDIFEDREHTIWVGTADKGVYFFNPAADAVKFYAGSDQGSQTLQPGSVETFTVLDSNTLFIGTDKGPSLLNLATGKYSNYVGKSTNGISGPMENVRVGMGESNGRYVWMGTSRHGLVKFDRKQNSFQNFSRVSKPYPLEDDGITKLLPLPDGNIFLLGFNTPGIFNPKTTEYFSYRNDSLKEVLQLKNINNACTDAAGNILLSSANASLYRYNPRSQKLADISYLLKPYPTLKTIYQVLTHQQEIFLVTNIGLLQLGAGDSHKRYSLNDAENTEQEFKGILFAKNNVVWICSNRKLGRLDLTSGKISFLGEKEGLKNVHLYPESLTESPKGSILVGSSNGYYEIFPERLNETMGSLPAFLTDFRVNDEPLKTEEPISGLQQVNLKYNENFFNFNISNFYYSGASDVEYAYKLEGFDKEWQYLGKKTNGSYTNVPGGDYKLRLRTRNADGVWNEKGQVVSISIAQHFTKTWWFQALIAFIILGLIYGFYRYRIGQINKQALVRSDYEIKLNELENSALRTQMNPHFIFNSLNTINSFISLNETTQAHKYIASFSRLIRFILDHSRQRKILLEQELDVLKLYIEIEQVRFSNKFSYEIIVDPSIDPSTVEVPPLVIQPFVENAILHGLLPADRSGLLKIKVEHSDDMLWITVEDDGVGRKKSASLRNQQFSLHKSHGIEITLKRISLFNKEFGKPGEVKISDLSQGTRVEIPLAWEESF